MKCPKCGTESPDNLRFCTRCGSALMAGAVPPQGQSYQPQSQMNNTQGNAPYQQPPQGGLVQPAQKKSPLVPILIACGAALLVTVGILLFFLLKGNDDSSNSVTDSTVVDNGSGGNGGSEDPSAVQPGTDNTQPENVSTSEPEPTATPEPTPKPTPTPYGASLKYLNDDIRINRTTTLTKIGQLKYFKLFNKKGKKIDLPIQIRIKCKRRSFGKKYNKAIFWVEYRFRTNPKAYMSQAARIRHYDKNKYLWRPYHFFTVFDYKTGKSLEVRNKRKEKMKCTRWKYRFYNKQYYSSSGWTYSWRNTKQLKFAFSVKYPKSYTDICVGVGFFNCFDSRKETRADKKYWRGTGVYGKTTCYRRGRDNTAYVLLSK